MTINLAEISRGVTLCFAKCGLAIGGTTSKAKLDNPDGSGYTNFAIDGIAYSVADGDNLVTLTGSVQTALYSRIYLVCINAANTITTVAGTMALTASVAAGLTPLEWPEPTANTCPIGAIRVDAGAGAFTPGTTALTGGTVTVTYYSLAGIPTAPIVA